MPKEPETIENIRADFIRRLFAVIVSVGFANQIIRMPSVESAQLPAGEDLQHFVYLILGLFLIIQSWEYYFSSVGKKPLTHVARFYTDITIVFAYLFLLTYSKSVLQFMVIVWVIFLLYALWDFLSFHEHPEYFKANNSKDDSALYPRRIIYAMGDNSSPLRSKVSTIFALIWFLELYFIYLDARDLSSYLYAVLIFVGLVVYRFDQSNPQNASLMGLLPLCGVIGFLFVHYFR